MANLAVVWWVGGLAFVGGIAMVVWSLVGARRWKRPAPRHDVYTAPIIAMPVPLPPAPIELEVLGPIAGADTTDFAVDTAVTTSIGDDIIASIESARRQPVRPARARLGSGSVAPPRLQTPSSRDEEIDAGYGMTMVTGTRSLASSRVPK